MNCFFSLDEIKRKKKSTRKHPKIEWRPPSMIIFTFFCGALGGVFVPLTGSILNRFLKNLFVSYGASCIIWILLCFNFYFILLKFIYKAEKLEDPKDLLTPFREENIRIDSVYIIPQMRKKTINAWATGLRRRYIFITKDAFSILNKNELIALTAHEVGHHLHRHLRKVELFTLLFLSLVLFVSFHLNNNNLLSFLVGITGILVFSCLALPSLMRRFEYQSDLYVKEMGYGYYLITTLKKIAECNKIPLKRGALANLISNHPSMNDRKKRLR